METTLNKIRSNDPCKDGWTKLLKHLGKTEADDEPLTILTILDSNGIEDALWCFCAVDGFEREKRLLAVAFARGVQHLDKTGVAKATLDVAERFANGDATDEELDASRHAARDAWAAGDAGAAGAAWAAARDARDARAARAAWDAAWAARDAAARAAARAAGGAGGAGDAALAARAAALAARAAAARAALAAQEKILRRYLTTGVISHDIEQWEKE